MVNNDKAQGGGDHMVIAGCVLFLVIALATKFEAWFSVWIKSPVNQGILIVALVGMMCPILYWLSLKRQSIVARKKREKAVLEKTEDSVFCGWTDKGDGVHIKPKQRSMHTQVVGTTNAGKTESVILPWAIQDIQQGRGLILIDGKSDRSLLNKLWSYTVASGRQDDFRLFSLSHIDESQQFNPLLGGTPEEISERVFNAFEFDDAYYRSVQFEIFSQIMRAFEAVDEFPTFLRLHQAISNPAALYAMMDKSPNSPLKQWLSQYCDLSASDRLQRTSGLTAALSHFAFGKTAELFNTEAPIINLDTALQENQIVYFQLPVLLSPFLGKATGKMILQNLQSAVGNRHRGIDRSLKFYSVFLDDFTEYLYPGFVSILNKSRSANVGIVFAHQALGDIKTLGEAVANSILTNSNLKIFMRGNDPESAEYFSQVIGTTKSVKYTERKQRGILSEHDTGEASAREVDEFIVHPNCFKSQLGVGEAVMVIPHECGSQAVTLKFQMFDNLDEKPMKKTEKAIAGPLSIMEVEQSAHSDEKNSSKRKWGANDAA